MQKGDAAALQSKWPEARDAFAEAVKVAPQSAPAHAKLGVAAWEAGDRPLALKEWAEALSLDALNAVALEGQARASLEAGDAGGAVTSLDKVINPTGGLRLTLARALLSRGQEGDVVRALELAKAALTETPTDPETQYVLGSAQIALKRYADAQATLDGLQRQHPRSALGGYGLARLAAAQSRQTDALLYLGEAKNAAGSSWNSERVAADPAFAFLAQTPEFKALVGK
jgi:hypothetical protein